MFSLQNVEKALVLLCFRSKMLKKHWSYCVFAPKVKKPLRFIGNMFNPCFHKTKQRVRGLGLHHSRWRSYEEPLQTSCLGKNGCGSRTGYGQPPFSSHSHLFTPKVRQTLTTATFLVTAGPGGPAMQSPVPRNPPEPLIASSVWGKRSHKRSRKITHKKKTPKKTHKKPPNEPLF